MAQVTRQTSALSARASLQCRSEQCGSTPRCCCGNLTATSETMELHAHFYACRGAALHQCCVYAVMVLKLTLWLTLALTLCRLGLVARFCGETTYQKLAESHVIGNVDMFQQDCDKSWKLNELCERTVAIDPCQKRLPQNATIAYTSGLIG